MVVRVLPAGVSSQRLADHGHIRRLWSCYRARSIESNTCSSTECGYTSCRVPSDHSACLIAWYERNTQKLDQLATGALSCANLCRDRHSCFPRPDRQDLLTKHLPPLSVYVLFCSPSDTQASSSTRFWVVMLVPVLPFLEHTLLICQQQFCGC